MSILKTIFGDRKKDKRKKDTKKLATKNLLKIQEIVRLTPDAVKVVFEVPLLEKEKFLYQPGQYLNIEIELDGKTQRRSYSICSDVNEPLAIGVKKIKDGVVSSYFNDVAKKGHEVKVSSPMGNFKIPVVAGNFVAIAGGSGITPLLSIAKMINRVEGAHLNLIYGSRNAQSIMFEDELAELSEDKVKVTHILSDQIQENVLSGLLTEEVLTKVFTQQPDLLKAKGFYICGPEPVIKNADKVLKEFGVDSDKIYFELFTVPVTIESKAGTKTKKSKAGTSKVTLILDGEEEHFELATNGDTILEEAESHGMDAPYSCRGGICSTCKAKVIKGTAIMDKNFTLSESEIEEGYILTCQAHPTSPEIIVSFDE